MKGRPPGKLIRLWGERWETWQAPDGAGQTWKLLGPSTGRESSANEQILAVPARHVVAAPLWVETEDPEVIKTSIELELEVRGLLPRKKTSDAESSRTLAEGGKTLVVSAVFPADIPEPHSGKIFARYEASPFLVEPAEDGATLWREQDDLVVVFARGRHAVYWATTDWPCTSRQARLWLEMLACHLVATGVLTGPPCRVLLDETLAGANGLNGLVADAPEEVARITPSLHGANFSWKPAPAREREIQATAQRKTKHLALALAAAYLIAVLAVAAQLGWLKAKTRFLQNQIDTLEGETAEFQPTLREWRLVGPGAETDFFPLEILHRVVRNLPAKGIRLTIFDTSDGRVTIEGEAMSVSLASEFFAAVSGDTELQALNWQMPTPSLLPNSAARFQLNGAIP